jgi:hypothetical protein
MALLACISMLAGASEPSGMPAAHFPAIQATSLNNTRFHLPQDFSGKLNLVIVSFAREQQPQADTWITAARSIQPKHSQFQYYELPTLSKENMLYRWWFAAGLRSNITNPDQRDRVLVAYVNKHGFLKSLGVDDEKQVTALLVDRSGKIYWRAQGICMEEEKLQLISVLTSNKI